MPASSDEESGPAAPFLSEGWLDALEAALRRHATPGPAGGQPGERLLLGQVVTGAGPAGVAASPALAGDEVRYTIALGGGLPPALRRGSVDDAQVTLVADYDAAAALAEGRASVAELLLDGRLKVRGDANALIAAQELLAALATAFGGGPGDGPPSGPAPDPVPPR